MFCRIYLPSSPVIHSKVPGWKVFKDFSSVCFVVICFSAKRKEKYIMIKNKIERICVSPTIQHTSIDNSLQ